MPTYKQTIPVFPNPPVRFLYIHIPRTAGRFLRNNILSNGFEPESSLIPVKEGIELNHLSREEYEQHYNIEDIPHITVVRNPIDRFISSSIFLKRMYGDDIQETMEDPVMFSSMIENFPLWQSVNWFRPQMDFISDQTQLWKFEDGFDKDFEDFISQTLGTEFQIKDVPYGKLSTDEFNKLEKSAKLIDNIKSLYRKDIEYLYPELAA